MDNAFLRTQSLIGESALEKLNSSKVAVFGLGGVGGYCAEALARSGVGEIALIDGDKIDVTNLNRQIIATRQNVGVLKTVAAKQRILSINPNCKVEEYPLFFLPENADTIDFKKYDYVIDAVDTVTAKLEIISRCKQYGVNVISAMGAGNKLDPTKFKVADIFETDVCPLCKVMRRELKKRNIDSLQVVYSDEKPVIKTDRAPASVAFVPPVMGLIIAGEVIKNLIK